MRADSVVIHTIPENDEVSSIGGVADTVMEKSLGSMRIDGHAYRAAAAGMEGIMPMIDVGSFANLLNQSKSQVVKRGAIPKIPLPSYEMWRRETDDLRKEQDRQQEQHNKEIELRRNREWDLVNRIQRLEDSRKQQFELQRQREADLVRQLQEREKEVTEFKKHRKKDSAERDAELHSLREMKRKFDLQFSTQREQVAATEVCATDGVPTVPGQSAKESMRKSMPDSSKDKIEPPGDSQVGVGNDPTNQITPSVSAPHSFASSLNSINPAPSNHPQYETDERSVSSPMGGRSHHSNCLSQPGPTFTPYVAPQYESPLNLPMLSPHVAPQYDPWQISHQAVPSVAYYDPMQFQRGPTQQQAMARQVISRELPPFTGDPTDWPMFISSYRHSTAACGYTDYENLLRLQRSLKSTAKEAVSSLLLHPSSVPQVISTLQTLYGRPEQIVYNMVAKVRSTPAPRADRLDTLVNFGLTVQNLCGHLKAVGLENHLSNPILLQELVEKLPPTVKFNWALYQQNLPIVDLSSFGDYMQKVTSATSSVATPLISQPKTNKEDRSRGKEKTFVNAHAAVDQQQLYQQAKRSNVPVNKAETSSTCLSCGGRNHQTASCATFRKLNVDARWKEVKEKQLCCRCLTSHSRWPCRGEICGVNGCQKRHHRLLHSNQHPTEKESTNETTNATVTVHRKLTSPTLFRMLPVTIYGSKGQVDTYAFLDDGSSVTMMEKSIAETLGLEGKAEKLCIHWTGGIQKKLCTQQVAVEISAIGSDKRFKASEVYVVDNLGLPEQTINFTEMEQRYDYLKGLPVRSFTTAVPGVMIGLNNIHLLATLKLREGRIGEPIATKTRIGWIVYGNLRGEVNHLPHRQMYIDTRKADEDLHSYVQKFFSLESLGINVVPKLESKDDHRARKILEETTKRNENGRFETGLLWKTDNVKFPDSAFMAEKRLMCLEKRLDRDPKLYNIVRQQIAEMQVKGYTHKATTRELAEFESDRSWFLPLGVVLNPKKPGKVRLIWDAAAKVKGVSLNTELLSGPDLLVPLLKVMFGFREKEVALCADIMEMFHQIQIRKEDRSAQLYKWRDSSHLPMETMVMDVAIFGATCSPAHSQFVKNKNADEHQEMYPRAAKAIKEKHYVDDYLDSLDTQEEAVELALEVAKVHDAGGFYIRNWISNYNTVLERIGETNPTTVKSFVGENQAERLLGIVWLPEEDVFTFKLNFCDEIRDCMEGLVTPSKREMLRVVMSIYDPLGLVAAFVIHGKILIQDVWRSRIDWDHKVPLDVFCRWKLWLNALRKMSEIKIPRCYFPGYNPSSYRSLQLHIFVDASEQAFAACAYFRIVDQGRVRCCLVASKTKVAPLKLLSIPRLELMAAVIGARLKKTVTENHSLEIQQTFYHSDAGTVLSWIRSDVRRYRQFVAYRVSEILSLSSVEEWRWVPTKLNVADEATKWGRGPSFEPESRIMTGPLFLYDDPEEWPKDYRAEVMETEEELRPAYVFSHFLTERLINFDNFSRWERLLRSVAYVHRFVSNLKQRHQKESGEDGRLTTLELQEAERTLWKLSQSEVYPDEVTTLKYNAQPNNTKLKKLERTNPLVKLSPVMDEYGVLRIDGRIANSEYADYDTKYPIILAKEHAVTTLLLDWYHRKFRHANNETIVNEIRQRFYVPNVRVQVRAAKKRCMWCQVNKSLPSPPRMGLLPRARLTPFKRSFTYTGIDYFGPYFVKVGRTAAKRWVALFTCLVTRAIHLEVACGLSTDSCKKAIRRFIARRGAPVEIYSDRGTNFVGANRELMDEIKLINTQLSSTFTDHKTQWKFNPPAAPHMGGCWERMVRSVKVALGTLPFERKLDDEALVTFLAEAEYMINSRPLTFVPIESDDHESLTPNHFLMLSSSGVKQPEKTPVNEGMALKGSWNKIQHTLDNFWRRWLKEYQPTITRRTKWFHDVRPIREGDLVVVADEGVRNRWIRGRVVRTHPGKDGIPRRADVRVADGSMMRDRPVTKLALLDVGNKSDAEPDVLATRRGGCC